MTMFITIESVKREGGIPPPKINKLITKICVRHLNFCLGMYVDIISEKIRSCHFLSKNILILLYLTWGRRAEVK